MSGFTLDIQVKDSGLKTLVAKLDKITGRAVKVGITAESPRGQFKRGQSQKFRPITASILLRKPLRAKKNEIAGRLTKIGREAFVKDINPDKALLALGNEIKADMDAQTDPPPQLRNAIIVELEDGA